MKGMVRYFNPFRIKKNLSNRDKKKGVINSDQDDSISIKTENSIVSSVYAQSELNHIFNQIDLVKSNINSNEWQTYNKNKTKQKNNIQIERSSKIFVGDKMIFNGSVLIKQYFERSEIANKSEVKVINISEQNDLNVSGK